MPDATPLSAHDAAMVAKVDAVSAATTLAATPESQVAPAAQAPAATVTPRPEHIPEKFWDAEKGEARYEDLAKAYVELESKQAKPADPPAGTEADPLAAVQAAGVDVASLQQEFDTTGALSEDSYAKLAKAGFGREVVDAHVAGVQALAEKTINTAFSLVGGQDTYTSMMAWAQTALPAAEVEAFNRAVIDPALSKAAILGVKAQFDAAVGTEPKLLSGTVQPAAGITPFASRAEVTEAMRDPRYRSDPAYRNLVAQRVDAMPSF